MGRRRRTRRYGAAMPPGSESPGQCRHHAMPNGGEELIALVGDEAGEPGRPKAAALGGRPGRTAPPGWESWELGPYVRWPEQRRRVAEFFLMRTLDPLVRTALTIIGRMILRRLGGYAHEDPDVADTVNEWLVPLDGGAQPARQLLSALWAGFAVVELRWTLGDQWLVTDTQLLHPLSFFARYGQNHGIALDPETGKVEVFRQLPQAQGETPIEFAPERVLYWPAFQELREQVFGCGLLEAARAYWHARVRLGNYWNTYCEKIACPTPVIQVPVDTIEDPQTGETISAAEYITALFAGLEPGMAIAVPYTPGQEWHITPFAPQGDGGAAFDLRLAALERDMWLAVLTPRLLLAEPEHSSRAQASTNLDLFLDVLEGIRAELGAVLEKQLCGRLIRYNLGADVPPGEWQWDVLTDEDLALLADVLVKVEQARTAAWQRGVPLEEDERKWREVFGAVLAGPDEVDYEAQQKEADSAAALAARVAAVAERYKL